MKTDLSQRGFLKASDPWTGSGLRRPLFLNARSATDCNPVTNPNGQLSVLLPSLGASQFHRLKLLQ